MHIKKDDFFKLPNILTYIRILLVPVFIYVFLTAKTPLQVLLAAGVVFLSALTDLLDGFIARKFNIITDWGKFIDPIADKLMQAAMFFCVVAKATGDKTLFFSLLIITILFVVKEIVSFLVSFFIYKKTGKHLDGSIWCGKACTVVIYFVMLLFIMFPDLGQLIKLFLILFAGVFIIIAFVVYMLEYQKMFFQHKNETRSV